MRKALFLLFFTVACRTAPADLPIEKAIVLPSHIEKAIATEQQLASAYDTLPAEGARWFETIPGKGRVLIVAGHATSQTREGARKGPDAGTGSLAVALHELTDSPVIYTTMRSPSDPNFYDDNEFKAAVAQLIEQHRPILVLDLHASHSYRPYDVDFGVMGGDSLRGREDWLRALARRLRHEGLMNLSRDYFPAAKNQTITKFVSSRGTPAMQLEISSTWLDADRDPINAHRFAQLLQALTRFIQEIDSH